MESLIGIAVFILVSIIGTWLQKRGQTTEEWPESTEAPPPTKPGETRPAPPASPKPAPASSWEEELRRLLEGEPPTPTPTPPQTASPPRPVAPPPLVPVPAPRPIQSRPLAPQPVARPAPPRPAVVVQLPTPTMADHTTIRQSVKPPKPPKPLTHMAELAQAHPTTTAEEISRRARQLETEASQLGKDIEPAAAVVQPRHRQASREIQQALGMMRGRPSIRQAFIASQVFGPPRGLARENPALTAGS